MHIAEFYAPDHGPGNLELLSRFYEKYPGYAERTFLSVKVRFTARLLCSYISLSTIAVGRQQA